MLCPPVFIQGCIFQEYIYSEVYFFKNIFIQEFIFSGIYLFSGLFIQGCFYSGVYFFKDIYIQGYIYSGIYLFRCIFIQGIDSYSGVFNFSMCGNSAIGFCMVCACLYCYSFSSSQQD